MFLSFIYTTQSISRNHHIHSSFSNVKFLNNTFPSLAETQYIPPPPVLVVCNIMNHYVQQAENFHDEMTILSMKASDDFLSQTRIRLPASSLYLPAKYVLLLQFFYGLKKPVGPKKRYLIVSSDQKKKRINMSFVFQVSP